MASEPTDAAIDRMIREECPECMALAELATQLRDERADAREDLRRARVSYDALLGENQHLRDRLAALEGQARQFRIERDQARREVTKIGDRLAALEASLTDEWGVRAVGNPTTIPGGTESMTRQFVHTCRAAKTAPREVMRRRVTRWEVADRG